MGRIEDFAEEIAIKAFERFLKKQKEPLPLKRHVSNVRDESLIGIGDLAQREGRDPFEMSRLIYVKALAKAGELYVEKQEKEIELAEAKKEMARVNGRKATRRKQEIQKSINENAEMQDIRECLKNNYHLLAEKDRPIKVSDDAIEDYFYEIGYDGSMEGFVWDEFDWEKYQKEKKEKELAEWDVVKESAVVSKKVEIKNIKSKSEAKKEIDSRVIKEGLFGDFGEKLGRK